jgi:hypothetical protein
MARSRLRLAALLMLVVALLGPAAHVLEIPGKLRLGPEEWLIVQQNLYAGFPIIGALGYVGAPLVCAAFAWSARGTREARPAWIAAALVLAAFAVWGLVVAPVNGWIAPATPGTLPPDWTAWRNRWEAGHAGAALLIVIALVLLLSATQPPRAASTSAARSAGQA